MLERISRHYGAEAAKSGKMRNTEYDKDFINWLNSTMSQFDPNDDSFDYDEEFDHLIDCWENGYDDYKTGNVM